jgi:hypothetical protein
MGTIPWHIEIEPDVQVLVDPTAFRPALHNMLKAAHCIAGPGGRVHITASPSYGSVLLTIAASAAPDASFAPVRADHRPTELAGDNWGTACEADATDARFAVSLARALLELQDAHLIEHAGAADRLRLEVRLDGAHQQDLLFGIDRCSEAPLLMRPPPLQPASDIPPVLR